MKSIKSLLLWLVAAFLLWRIVVVNVTEFYAANNDPKVTSWNATHPKSLLLASKNLVEKNLPEARKLLQKSVFVNPANGQTLAALALVWQQEGNLKLAKQAAHFAGLFSPKDAATQYVLGTFYFSAEEPVLALKHWSVAIDGDPQYSKQLFPIMLQVMEARAYKVRGVEAVKDADKWWPRFFVHAINNTADSEVLKGLYVARAERVDQATRKLYLDYLIRTGSYVDAYFIWLNGMPQDDLSVLGNVFDGSFESVPTNEGFGWRVANDSGLMTTFESVYGQVGNKALHVTFLDGIHRRVLVNQYLMLDAGNYRFSGKSRLESLSAGKGIFWSIQCLDVKHNQQVLKTDYFNGSDVWQNFEIDFMLPAENCPIQQLRLEADGSVNDNYADYSGSAWFDGLEILKLELPPTLVNTQ